MDLNVPLMAWIGRYRPTVGKIRYNFSKPPLISHLKSSVADPGSDFLPLDPGSGMSKKLGYGSDMKNPDHISECVETIFFRMLFSSLTFKMPQKKLFSKFLCLSFLTGHLHRSLKIKNHKEVINHWPVEIMVFLHLFTCWQCCGSGSGIRWLFDPWIRDPE